MHVSLSKQCGFGTNLRDPVRALVYITNIVGATWSHGATNVAALLNYRNRGLRRCKANATRLILSRYTWRARETISRLLRQQILNPHSKIERQQNWLQSNVLTDEKGGVLLTPRDCEHQGIISACRSWGLDTPNTPLNTTTRRTLNAKRKLA